MEVFIGTYLLIDLCYQFSGQGYFAPDREARRQNKRHSNALRFIATSYFRFRESRPNLIRN